MLANDAWIAMFHKIPFNLHDALALGLTTGAEIVIQKIIKLEPDFVLARGRLSGTSDIGRVVMIPYPELVYVALTRPLSDAEVDSIFGKGAPPPVLEISALGEPNKPNAVDAEAEEDTVNDEPAEVNPSKGPAQQTKAALLNKLRNRLKESGK